MPTVNRTLIKSEVYQGRTLQARYMGPDLLSYCNGNEMPGFYIDVEAALRAGRKFVDAEEKLAQELAARNARVK